MKSEVAASLLRRAESDARYAPFIPFAQHIAEFAEAEAEKRVREEMRERAVEAYREVCECYGDENRCRIDGLPCNILCYKMKKFLRALDNLKTE